MSRRSTREIWRWAKAGDDAKATAVHAPMRWPPITVMSRWRNLRPMMLPWLLIVDFPKVVIERHKRRIADRPHHLAERVVEVIKLDRARGLRTMPEYVGFFSETSQGIRAIRKSEWKPEEETSWVRVRISATAGVWNGDGERH